MKKRVLVVDDDPDVRALVSLTLRALGGYTVETSPSASDALEQARSFAPDLILLDVMMPGMDGRQALKALRADEATAHIPVIFISAGVDRSDAPEYRALGALGVIPKPFDPALLPATLERMCHGQPIEEAHRPDLETLRAAYCTDLPATIGGMEALAARLVAGGWRQPIVESLFERAHRMAGTAGMYGLDTVGRSAGILAAELKRLLEDPRWPPSRPAAEVATLVKALARCVPGRDRRARARPPRVAL